MRGNNVIRSANRLSQRAVFVVTEKKTKNLPHAIGGEQSENPEPDFTLMPI